jgi:patatin-like phospholipase/acyl hydrolase
MPYLDPTSSGKIHPIDVRAQSLCLSGGGYRGLYTVRILEHLQTLTTKPLHTHFRFIAGTSIGSIIAAALAAGVKPQRIREEIEAVGPKVFERRRFHRTQRMFFSAPFKQDLLSETLTKLFTEINASYLLDTPIAETNLAIIITATSASAHEPRIYGGNNLALHPQASISLRDAVLASSAAPTYFPARIAAGEKLIDGGVTSRFNQNSSSQDT